MSDNGYLSGCSGCRLNIAPNAAAVSAWRAAGGPASGAALPGVVITSGSCVVQAADPEGLKADMLVSGGGAVTIATTMPENLTSAYAEYVEDKREAIWSGGSCVYPGSAQTFTAGSSYSALCQQQLMTLNGVKGSLEKGDTGHVYKSNINFLPTVGIWVETDKLSSEEVASVFRAIKNCVSCEDYNSLFVLQMILYHAINKIAWRIMRGVANDAYTPGVWQQYQGAVYRWNAYTYAKQYAYELQASEDTFTLKLGWINTTCTKNVGFAAWAAIQFTEAAAGTAQYLRYHLLYGGSPTTNNTGTKIVFIANTSTSTIYYVAGNAPDAATLAKAGNPSIDVFSYTTVTSIQDFNTPANLGQWVVGIICTDMSGDAYGATAVQLGIAQQLASGVDLEVSQTERWTYTITAHWTTNIAGVNDSYNREPIDSVTINGLAAATSA